MDGRTGSAVATAAAAATAAATAASATTNQQRHHGKKVLSLAVALLFFVHEKESQQNRSSTSLWKKQFPGNRKHATEARLPSRVKKLGGVGTPLLLFALYGGTAQLRRAHTRTQSPPQCSRFEKSTSVVLYVEDRNHPNWRMINNFFLEQNKGIKRRGDFAGRFPERTGALSFVPATKMTPKPTIGSTNDNDDDVDDDDDDNDVSLATTKENPSRRQRRDLATRQEACNPNCAIVREAVG
ncbi:hypothetical protein V1478_015999 [Vespula squamosa]|uniref:Uncharacterized protein n=1 Tax=Vespula squamosa TaxID=30214 RepID=A0ABD2A2H5_VESSQ